MNINMGKSRAGNQRESGQGERFTRTYIQRHRPAKEREIFLNDIHNKAIVTRLYMVLPWGGGVLS